MTSIAATREASDPTAASPTTAGEPLTGRTPTAWSAGHGDESQPETFRALAWSQADDSLAEPLPYTGVEDSVPEMDSGPTERMADSSERASTPRSRRSALLSVIAAGFAAAAVGGLVLIVVNTDSVPTTTSPVVIRPVQNSSLPQSTGETGSQGGAIRPAPAAPAPAKMAGSPARAVAPAPNNPPTGLNTPLPTVAAVTPAAPPPPAPEVTAPLVPAPVVPAPVVPAPVVPAPADPAPDLAVPEAAPPVGEPPLAKPPVVSLPVVPPQEVPHPMGPIVIHTPAIPEDPTAQKPNLAGSVPVVIQGPTTPAAPDPRIALKPGVTDPIIPTFTVESGQ